MEIATWIFLYEKAVLQLSEGHPEHVNVQWLLPSPHFWCCLIPLSMTWAKRMFPSAMALVGGI